MFADDYGVSADVDITDRSVRQNCQIDEILLAMIVDSDTNSDGVSRGSVRRTYEGVGKNPSLYPYLQRLFRPAKRSGDDLLF